MENFELKITNPLAKSICEIFWVIGIGFVMIFVLKF